GERGGATGALDRRPQLEMPAAEVAPDQSLAQERLDVGVLDLEGHRVAEARRRPDREVTRERAPAQRSREWRQLQLAGAERDPRSHLAEEEAVTQAHRADGKTTCPAEGARGPAEACLEVELIEAGDGFLGFPCHHHHALAHRQLREDNVEASRCWWGR